MAEPELPPEALAAEVVCYGGVPNCALNGVLVDLGDYLANLGYFEAHLSREVVDGKRKYEVGDVVLCKASELKPLNAAAAAYMDNAMEANVEFYPEDVYDLRDALAEVGIFVTAASIHTWNFDQCDRVRAWVRVCREGKLTPSTIKPEVIR